MEISTQPMVNNRREIFGWAMFDWAISAFSTTVITVFLGPYLTSITKAAADASGMITCPVPIRYIHFLISASVLASLFAHPGAWLFSPAQC
jgi:UMF1 family MFS transporter